MDIMIMMNILVERTRLFAGLDDSIIPFTLGVSIYKQWSDFCESFCYPSLLPRHFNTFYQS
jgi:hypothetical protein